MIANILEALIGALLWAINLVIDALNDVIHFIVTTISKILRILRLSVELIFYLLPFGEVIYIGHHKDILWLTILGWAFIVIFGLALLRALFQRARGADTRDTERQYVGRDRIFAAFVLFNLALGGLAASLYFNLQLPK
jgi:hypothetical protein